MYVGMCHKKTVINFQIEVLFYPENGRKKILQNYNFFKSTRGYNQEHRIADVYRR